eukprot:TRINITY_DN1133_c0_g1_i1.p1 TRINITY_DN1133_c0_g1~~TRINITY_DN1133_c0_g1_i1.p1  ORF type:complete len:409 (-),score=70.55 TRINITY_DN1133_c0_g1_i1:211-1437(-)
MMMGPSSPQNISNWGQLPGSGSHSSPTTPPGSQAGSPKRSSNDIEKEINNQNLYKTELCRSFVETGVCRYGSKCQFAHGMPELRPVLRHPKYKTEVCKTYHLVGTCPYGTRCRFIHKKPDTEIGDNCVFLPPPLNTIASDAPSIWQEPGSPPGSQQLGMGQQQQQHHQQQQQHHQLPNHAHQQQQHQQLQHQAHHQQQQHSLPPPHLHSLAIALSQSAPNLPTHHNQAHHHKHHQQVHHHVAHVHPHHHHSHAHHHHSSAHSVNHMNGNSSSAIQPHSSHGHGHQPASLPSHPLTHVPSSGSTSTASSSSTSASPHGSALRSDRDGVVHVHSGTGRTKRSNTITIVNTTTAPSMPRGIPTRRRSNSSSTRLPIFQNLCNDDDVEASLLAVGANASHTTNINRVLSSSS